MLIWVLKQQKTDEKSAQYVLKFQHSQLDKMSVIDVGLIGL